MFDLQKSLVGHLDTRFVPFPAEWGIDGGFTVRRADHPDWQEVVRRREEENPLSGVVVERALAINIADGAESRKKGFRQGKKPTKAQQRDAEDDSLERALSAFKGVGKEVNILRMTREAEEALREDVPAYLVTGWRGITADGQDVPFSAEVCRDFFDIKRPNGAHATLGDICPQVTEGADEVWADALVDLVLKAARDLAAYRADQVEEALGNSETSPGGGPSTGLGDPSPSDVTCSTSSI